VSLALIPLTPSPGRAVTLTEWYAYPEPPPEDGWVRANMISSLDGSAVGSDGLSGPLGGAGDREVFSVLRGLADVVLVGAGTARAEAYRVPVPKPRFAGRRAAAGQRPAPVLALVTRSGQVPPELADSAFVVTCDGAGPEALRRTYGTDRVIVAGSEDVDPVLARRELARRGLRRILLEGGPRLLGRAVAAGAVDELCLTLSATLVGGSGPRIATGPGARIRLRLQHLLLAEVDGEPTGELMGRWLVA
jgi:5-amino-6-(5-phosphoribosylamino)uracil reductase